jgi:protein-S-isoprenylcysteine O-methyltransferase Ste14
VGVRLAHLDDLNSPPPKSLPERLLDAALGLSVWSWAVLGLVHAEPAARISPVRLTIAFVNLCVGALFLARAPVVLRASVPSLLLCVPSVAMSGVALKLAPPEGAWPMPAVVLFVASGIFTAASLVTLGRCFGLLPAVRGVVTGGLFGWIRHPVYAGELGLIAACAIASERPEVAFPVLGLAALLIAARVRVEERLLGQVPAYREYARRVRFRVIPWLW